MTNLGALDQMLPKDSDPTRSSTPPTPGLNNERTRNQLLPHPSIQGEQEDDEHNHRGKGGTNLSTPPVAKEKKKLIFKKV